MNKGQIDILRMNNSTTFSEFTQEFSRYLGSGCLGGLRVVYVVALSDRA